MGMEVLRVVGRTDVVHRYLERDTHYTGQNSRRTVFCIQLRHKVFPVMEDLYDGILTGNPYAKFWVIVSQLMRVT